MGTVSIFSEVKQKNRLTRLENESFVTIFGDTEIDFTSTPLAPGDHMISTVTIFGDTDFRFPEDVGIRIEGAAIFGDTKVRHQPSGERERPGGGYQTQNFDTAHTRVLIKHVTLFGDLEIERVAVATPSEAYEGATHRFD